MTSNKRSVISGNKKKHFGSLRR